MISTEPASDDAEHVAWVFSNAAVPWTQAGFDPDQGWAWSQIGITVTEARDWDAAGFGPRPAAAAMDVVREARIVSPNPFTMVACEPPEIAAMASRHGMRAAYRTAEPCGVTPETMRRFLEVLWEAHLQDHHPDARRGWQHLMFAIALRKDSRTLVLRHWWNKYRPQRLGA